MVRSVEKLPKILERNENERQPLGIAAGSLTSPYKRTGGMKLFAWVIALELLGIALVLILLGHGKIQRELSEEIPRLMGTMEP
jgi:hypothetical protein